MSSRRSNRKPKGKYIGYRDIIGDRGIALIHTIVGEMGFVWNATKLEAGIDGYIEIRNPVTGEMTNLIIQVQSKATDQDFQAETSTGFYYYCEQRDLHYWLSGNAPVILVRSRPATKEAYWVSIKDYFKNLSSRSSGKVHFDKTKDRFDVTARDALFDLAKPRDAGLYLSPLPKQEKLYSNLLPIESFAERMYVAETEYRRRGELWRAFDELGVDFGAEWILRNQRIISFHDLRKYPWSEMCDQGTVECFDTGEWANADDPDIMREFVELLNHALKQKLLPAVWYNKRRGYYYFAPSADLKPYRFYYQSLVKKIPRVVFQAYPKKDNPKEISYYRHFAFSGAFVRYDDLWYLEITPTYRYTWNGYYWASQGEELLKGIKRKERNPAVLGQVIMWAEYLKQPSDMFRKPYPFLSFGSLVSFDLDAGIPDDVWLPNDDADLTVNQLSLFGLSKG